MASSAQSKAYFFFLFSFQISWQYTIGCMFNTAHNDFSHTHRKLYKSDIQVLKPDTHVLKPDTHCCGNKQVAAASYQLGAITAQGKPMDEARTE